ncbi:MAG: hypothetical protein IJI45_18335 [Anaerolineaceae bacterium]|nr:hypothetical protein [Anaerolineaceae bacterium]
MASFKLELPTEIMKDFQKIYTNSDKIFGAMTKAGADVVYHNIVSHVPPSIRKSAMMGCLRITRVYKTPSDDGINTKVGFYGYFTNRNGKRTPAPLVANVFEYGSTRVQKKPFLRKSFNRSAIEKAMRKAQKEASGGLLDE